MPWLRMQMGGGIGAYCLFMLVLAMSVDELFYISPIHGFKDKNGMSIGIHCGSVMVRFLFLVLITVHLLS